MKKEQQTPLQQAAHKAVTTNDWIGCKEGTITKWGMNLFVKGANWQRNHVWHNASEEPEHEREILLLCVDGTTFKGFYEGGDLDTAIDIICNGEKWAYLSDLLPQND